MLPAAPLATFVADGCAAGAVLVGLDTPPVAGLDACLPARVGCPPSGGFLGACEDDREVPVRTGCRPAGCWWEPSGTTPASAAECCAAGAGVVAWVVAGAGVGLDGVVAGAGVVLVTVVLVVVCEPPSPACAPGVPAVVGVPGTGWVSAASAQPVSGAAVNPPPASAERAARRAHARALRPPLRRRP